MARIAAAEFRAQRAEDLLSRNEGRIKEIVDDHLAARIAALEGALREVDCQLGAIVDDECTCEPCRARALATPGEATEDVD